MNWSYFKYIAFSTHKYFNGPSRKSTLFSFRALKMFFYVLKHNISMWLNWLKDVEKRLKKGFYQLLGARSTRKLVEIHNTSQRNATFILVCTIFEKLWHQRKKAAYRFNHFVCTKKKFELRLSNTRLLLVGHHFVYHLLTFYSKYYLFHRLIQQISWNKSVFIPQHLSIKSLRHFLCTSSWRVCE